LVQGYFQLHALHQQAFEKAPQLQPAYKVIGKTKAKTRLDAASRLSALVGRQTELALLHTLWNEALEDGGRLLLIQGDAGLGKSRLIRALRDTLTGTARTIRELHCFPEYSQTPLYPVIALLSSLSGFTPDEPSAIRLQKLSAHLAKHHPALHDEAMSLLAPLLSKNTEDGPSSPWQRQKQRTLAILLELMNSTAAQQPLLILLEDLHWMDPSSLELLERFTRIRTKKPVLMLLTARNDFQPPWISAETSLDLAPLSDDDIAQLVAGVNSSLPPETIRHITARADGVPLFAEEMALLAAEPSHVDEIPATLHFLLRARLDLLKEIRRIAQLAATVGRNFDRELLEQVAEVDSHSLDKAVSDLLDAHLITASPESTTDFRFRHGLIQEAAYHSQTRNDRETAHRRIAEALATHFPRRATRQPEQVARHFTQAGAAAEAIPWWLAAGRRALRTFAYPEAVSHLHSGLSLIRQRPPDKERDNLELDFLLPLGQALLALRGYGSAEAVAVYDRAFELCQDLAPGLRRFEVLWGLWMVSSSRQNSSFSTSTRLAQELLQNARDGNDAELLAYAHSANANVSLWRGEIDTACRHAEIAIASSPKTKRLDRLGGHDPHVSSLGHLSWARFYQGQNRKALAASRRSIEVAQQLSDPDSTCFALVYAGELRRFMHDAAGTIRYAQEALVLADQYQLALWQGGSAMQLGWARAFAGDAGGIDQITASAAAMTEVMPGVLVSFLHALAEAYGFLGQSEAQLDTVKKALHAAASADEHFHEAELYRLKGESLARLDRPREALDALREAKRIAHAQGAQAITLRASTAIALALP
jgi:tetratricopeptide (TPR) repeat protein